MKMNAEKRFLALFLVMVMVFSIMPLSVYAKTSLNTTILDGKISVKTTGGTSGQKSGSVNADGSITVGVTAVTNCLGIFSSTASHTVTISNTTQDKQMLAFTYTSSNLGVLKIDGTTMEAQGSVSKSLEAGGTIVLELTSAENTSETAVVLSNLELMDTGAKNVTVQKTEGGTTTVNGTTLTAATTTVTTDYVTGVTVTATPASGYVFLGWVDHNYNVVSTNASTVIQPLEEMGVGAYFVTNDAQAYWLGGGKLHTDLNQAAQAALNGDKKVILMKNGTLGEGTYTIPAGVKMVIPKDEAITTYGAEPALSANGAKWKNPTAFRTLTLTKGAKLVINGELELVAQHHVSAGSCLYGGAIDGAYGHIATAEGSAIEVYGTMYAWGVVSGEGVVTAFSGATIHEKMQINDYRGGSATLAMVTSSSKKVFPFSQYYVQNVEVKEVIHSGASLVVNAGVFLSEPEQASIAFVGPTSAMFTMGDGAVVTKEYDEVNDRLVVDINGNVALDSIALSFQGQNIDSAKFRLGINNNIDIRIHRGITTINQEMVLQSGATVSLDREAVIYNATNIYVMDAEDWGTYARSKTLIPVKWSYANGTTVKRTDVTDAMVDINGTVINNGQFFTTGSESVISSGKTGVIFYNTPANDTDTINQATANSATNMGWVSIACTAAVLVNGDGSTVTATGAQYDGFIYDSILNRWEQKNFVGNGTGYIPVLSFNANGGTGSMDSISMDYLTAVGTFAQAGFMPELSVMLPNSSFVRDGYDFIGWSANASATEADFIPGNYVAFSQDHTLYAVWSAKSFSLIIDGVAQDVPVGSDLSAYLPANPSKDGFTFGGWIYSKADGTAVDALTTMPAYDLVITAKWDEIKSYTLTFLDENGNVLDEFTYVAGEQVTATYPAYTKNNYVITWSAEIPATLTGDVEISAIATPNVYNITYIIDGAEAGDDQATESNNWTVSLLQPTKAGYEFLGWAYAADATAADITAAELALTGDVTVYAVWAINTYTITFNGVGEPIVLTYAYGAAITAPADPEMEGYTFTGWANREDGSAVPATMPAADLIFDAEWEQIIYTLSWDIDGDGDVDTTTHVAHNGFVGTTPDAVVPGMTATTVYTFGGWVDANGATVDASTVVTGDMAITANIIASHRAYHLAGLIGGEWGDVEANKMTPNGDGTYTFTVHMNPGTFEFKVHSGDAWYGCNTTIVDNTSGYKYNFYADNDNCGFKSTEAATYTFVWDTADNTLVVTWVPDHIHEYTYSYSWANYYSRCSVTKSCACGQTTKASANVTAAVNGSTITFTASYENSTDVVELYYYDNNVVYYDNSSTKWSDVAAYYWKKSTNSGSVTWPGPKMTKVAGYNNLYMIVVPADCDMIIFSNFNGGSQTDDLAIPTNGCNVYTNNKWGYVEPAKYTVTWNVDGNVTTETYYQGQTPVFTGSTDKAATAEYTYTFTGWDKDIVAVSGNETYTAKYQAEPNTYRLNFDYCDGLENHYVVPFGYTVPAEDLALLANYSRDGYRLMGWNTKADGSGEPFDVTADFLMPACDVTVYAIWAEEFDIVYRYVDMDGIDQEYFTANGIAGEVIQLDSMIWWNYATFAGWDANGDGVVDYEGYADFTVTGDVTLYAVFNAFYGTVDLGAEDATFVDAAGNPITAIYAQNNVNWVEMTNFPVRPGYTFIGWKDSDGTEFMVDNGVVNISFYTNTTLTALWQVNTYTVTFTINGEFYSSVDVVYGQSITAPEYTIPTGYSFSGWTVPGTMPGEDITLDATLSINMYTIIFKDEDGRVISEQQVAYGEMPEIPADPTKAPDAEYTYYFDCWTPAVVEATEDATYTATYYGQGNRYPVNFYVDGEIWKTVSFRFGTDIAWSNMADAAKEGYTFIGWVDANGNPASEIVTMPAHGIDVYAQFEINTYTITWIVNGVEIYETYEYGQTPVFTGSTDKAQNGCVVYTFAGWDSEIAVVTGDASYTATYTESLSHTAGQAVVENNVDPDCDDAGSYDNVVYCTVCGEELKRDTVTVDALGHTAGQAVVENNVDPDCDDAGSYDNVIYCTVCGEELKRDTVTVDALGHGHTEGISYEEGDGNHDVFCDDCYTTIEWNVPCTYDENTHACICGNVEMFSITFTDEPGYEMAEWSYTITKPYGEAFTQADWDALYAAIPVIQNYYVKSWYCLDEDGNNVTFEFPDTMPGYDQTVYATWAGVSSIVHFYTDPSMSEDSYLIAAYFRYGEYYDSLEDFIHINLLDDLAPEGMYAVAVKYADGTDLEFPYTHGTEGMNLYVKYICKEHSSEAINVSGYEWAADFSSCTVTGICQCGTEVVEVAAISSTQLKPANCVSPAWMQYTAAFMVEWAETQTVEGSNYNSTIDPNTHIYGTHAVNNGDGTHTLICNACSIPMSEPINHRTEENIAGGFAGNCLNNSVTHYYCSACGTQETITGDVNPDIHATDLIVSVDNGDGTHNVIHPCCETLIEVQAHEVKVIDSFAGSCYKKSSVTYGCDCGYYYIVEGDYKHSSNETWHEDNGDGTHSLVHGCCHTVISTEAHYIAVIISEWAGNCISKSNVYGTCVCNAPVLVEGDYNKDVHAYTNPSKVYVDENTHNIYYGCCDTVVKTEGHIYQDYSDEFFYCDCGAGFNGIYTTDNGDIFYVENGEAVENKGLVKTIDENGLTVYYYFGCGIEGCSAGDACQGNFKAQKSCRHYAGITNGLLVEGGYTIGDDGIIEHYENLQGIQTIDGTKFYLIDGVKVAIGLVEVDGEFYYARSNGALVIGQDYYISKTNGLTYNGEAIAKGSYTFDTEGKIVWAQPELKNGIYAEDGSLYYYVDGVRNYAGLIIYTGDLNNADGTITKGVYNNSMIYVNTKGEVKNGCTYWISKNNGLIAKNQAFTFDANGIVVEEKDGFYFEDGYWYYYVNGSKNYAGLIWCNGPEGNDPGYYYVNSKCQLITDCTYWISKNNGYMSNQAYTFGANGKMEQVTNDSDELLNGFVEENGEIYYYENGIKTYAGLILVDGSYYYVNSKCQVIRDCTYWISKNNGYMKNAAYTFDANGAMIIE